MRPGADGDGTGEVLYDYDYDYDDDDASRLTQVDYPVALQSFCKLGPGVTPFLISRRLP
jgi:hypothetical protein